jgi:deoxycytidine triphosphate deaminase
MQSGMMLSDADITAQLSAGDNADLKVSDPAEECITPVGYDVRAGHELFSYARKKIINLRHSEYEIAPGDTVFISSKEKFVLSKRMGGFTVARLGPQLDGLQLSACTVDPTFQGELLIILTNVGRKPVKIKYEQRLMTLCLAWMASPSNKHVERSKWGRDDIHKKFREMEKEASREHVKNIAIDSVVLGLIAILVVVLRHYKILETNENSILLGLTAISLYSAVFRKWIFGWGG